MGNATTQHGTGTAGTTAARPAVVPTGVTYFDTDLGKLLVFNGTAWIIIETGLAA